MSNAADDHGDDLDELGDEGELPEVIHITDDLDEYVEKERYKAIFAAKQEAADTLREYGNPKTLASNPAELQAIREQVSAAVISYITEIRRILEETEAGRDLWEDTEIATLPVGDTVTLPGEVRNASRVSGLRPVEHTPQPPQPQRDNGRQYYTMDGSGQLVECRNPARERFTNGTTNYYYVLNGVADYLTLHDTEATVKQLKDAAGLNRGKTSETLAVDPYPPVATSRDVYQKLTRLLADTGLDVELGEPDGDEWEL